MTRMKTWPIIALLAGLSLLPGGALAAEWGGIEPGGTTLEQVRDRYGAPAKETKSKVEGYDTTAWTYEGSRAPTGMIRMVVDFGLLAPDGYKPAVVRVFRLEPKRWIFGQNTIVDGWGVPDRSWSEDNRVNFFYKSGLVVVFEKDGQNALTLYFTVPQPEQPASGSPPSQPPAPASGQPSPPPR